MENRLVRGSLQEKNGTSSKRKLKRGAEEKKQEKDPFRIGMAAFCIFRLDIFGQIAVDDSNCSFTA